MDANLDFLGVNSGQGDLANYMISNGRIDPGVLRPWVDKKGKVWVTVHKGGDPKDIKNYQNVPIQTNATLRPDEWKALDEAIIPIAESRLNGVADLIEKGLVYNLGNPMGTTILESHAVSDAMNAELSMDGVTRSKGDRPVFTPGYLPIPIIHVDYEINARVLAASRTLGNSLDTTSAERAARKVAEKLENMLFTNTTYAFGGGTIYSYTNFTHRNEITLSTRPGGNWDASAKTGAQVINDVRAMKQASINDNFYGPWMLYIPTAYETVLDKDYDATTPGTTIRERIMKIGGILGVKVVDTLTANNVLLVQMTSDVVRLVRGMAITNVQWQTEGNFVNKFKVFTIQVPQIRADYNNKCGIVHLA